jgi:hypothetical protein
MKRFLNAAILTLGALVFSMSAARDAGAAQLTLNLVQAESHITLSGAFAGPFLPQDAGAPAVPGVVDYDLAHPSNYTTFQGPIVIDVDSVSAPTTIQILSAAADADLSGEWLPEVEPYLDLDMDGNFGELGEDSLPATGTGGDPPDPAMPADWGIRNVFSGAVNIVYGAARDIVYNVTSPVEPVVGGQFSSLNENFEFSSGWLDYWITFAANFRGRAELAGGDDDNESALLSSYTVTPLPFNQREIKLIIPIDISDTGGDADFLYNGQFVATLVVPEPSAIAMLCGGLVMSLLARRKRA